MVDDDQDTAGKANFGPDDGNRHLHSRGFNPFELGENCFYVALGRIMSIASIDVARIAGQSETDTTGKGMDFRRQGEIIDLLKKLTGRDIKRINLQKDFVQDYCLLNSGDGPTIAKLLSVAKKYGLDNSCLAVEIFASGNQLGHYISVYPSGHRPWDAETDKPLFDVWDPKLWAVDDFQRHYPWDEVSELFHDAVIRTVIGSTNGAHNTIYGSKHTVPLKERPELEASSLGKDRYNRPDAAWDPSAGRWKYHGFYYRGCWGRGYCDGKNQSFGNRPTWRQVDPERADGDGSWEYSFDTTTWSPIRYEEVLLNTGWKTVNRSRTK